MTIGRRGFLFGAVGFCVGGAVAITSGLGFYYARRARLASQIVAPRSFDESGLEEWVLTEADLSEIADRGALPKTRSMELSDNIDFPGAGDLESLRVSGVSECIASCEANDECNAFTFARMSHPRADKRHMCWLKSEPNPERRIPDVHYVSGRKP